MQRVHLDRQKSCPEQLGSRPAGTKGAGKRFARRAKRWAELQQRRAGIRREEVDLAALQHGLQQGVYAIDDERLHGSLAPARSLPFTLFNPRRQEQAVFYPFEMDETQVYYTPGMNEYGQSDYARQQQLQQRMLFQQQSPPELTVYPPMQAARRWDDEEMLSLTTSAMSHASISNSNSSSDSLSTSPSGHNSSSDNDELYSYSSSGEFHRSARRAYSGGSVATTTHSSSPSPPPEFVSTAPPPDRNWVMIRHADPDRPIATFTVLCYNVLCDKYATANLYSYCPTWALNWEYRKMSIIKEIRNYEADIITLQEVETEQYNMLFKPELSALGYESIFSPKSRAKTMNEEDRKYVDGCAIFWKRDKFEMEREHLIEFTQVAIKRAQNSDAMLNRVMPKDNIALCAVLRIKDQVYNNRRHVLSAADNVVDSPLVVCTAHIHWDPEFCDVKLVQTMMLVDELWKLVENVAAKFRITPQQTPCLVCGDLNSLPDSGVFEFLSRGQISRQHGDLKGFREDTCLEKFTAHKDDRQNFTHPLRLDSAVDQTSVQFTNYTLDFKGMIDYIFSTPQSLARLGVLGAFDLNWVHHNKIIGFPHPHVPSDHIPIMAQYAIIPTGHQRPLTSQSQTSQSQQQTPIGGGYSR